MLLYGDQQESKSSAFNSSHSVFNLSSVKNQKLLKFHAMLNYQNKAEVSIQNECFEASLDRDNDDTLKNRANMKIIIDDIEKF